MSTVTRILTILLILSAIMIFLTYSPADNSFFWIYWVCFNLLHLFPLFVLFERLFSITIILKYFPFFIVHNICSTFLWITTRLHVHSRPNLCV